MKKTIYLFFVTLMLIGITATAQVTNTVTFQADMSALIADGFDPATDNIEVRGLDWDNGSDVTVTGDRLMAIDGTTASVTLTIETTAALAVGDSLRWKFHGYPDENFDPSWEGGISSTEWDGRAYVLQASGSTVTLDAVQPELGIFVAGISNTITFKADLTEIFGSGVGFFDPAVDNIELRGFWGDGAQGWVDAAVIDGVTGTMVRNLDPGVVYETTVTLQLGEGLAPGTATSFKFKTYPDERWADGGWEIGSNNPIVFQEDGAEWEFYKVTNIFPKGEALGQDVNVLFQLYVPDNALNVYDSSHIPRDEIDFIILKGDNPAIGLWGGDWVADDTLTAGAVAMYDNGRNGDLVAGDYIWSRHVTFDDTLQSGGVIYKFGAQYPGAGQVAQSSPLDNYRGFGQNNSFFLRVVDSTIVLYDEWELTGNVTSVELADGEIPSNYELAQNYPNPFNPSTKINYSIPVESEVSLRIFDLLGREIATLVNSKQAAGKYEATFDAASLSTGIYFYRLDAGNVSISKKMMFVK